MNLHLDNTYEIIQQESGTDKTEELIGEIFIRCNNVLLIREAAKPEVEEDSKIKDEDVPVEESN